MANSVIQLPTREILKRKLPGNDKVFSLLELLTLNISKWDDDFQGDTLHGGYQSTASGAGSAAAAISAGLQGGAVILVTGTDADGRSDLSLGLHFAGNSNVVIAARLKISAISGAKIEIGFTDVVSGTDAGAVATKATPTFNANGCALWAFDTNDNDYWEGIAALEGVAATTVEAAISPAADTYEWMIVALNGTSAKYLRLNADAEKTYESAWQTSAITAATLLTPWVFVQTRNTTSKTLTLDRWIVYQRSSTGA